LSRKWQTDADPWLLGNCDQYHEQIPFAIALLTRQRGLLGEPGELLQFGHDQNRQPGCARSDDYRLPAFKAALLALVESFDATYCSAYPQQIMDFWDPSRHLRIAWMSYVSPRFASLITPPPSAVAERTAQGGLLITATEETFRVDNPAHLAAAHDILKALAPFEALPWPPDATPE